MEDTINIQLTIGDRRYPLKVLRQDEPLARQAEHLINEKFNEFQLRFTGQEKIDYLAMSALMNMVDLLKLETREKSGTGELMEKLLQAEKLLNQAGKP